MDAKLEAERWMSTASTTDGNTAPETLCSTRFDTLVRSERYFTATLLPVILFHNDLRGLDAFLAMVDSKALLRDRQPTERGRTGDPIGRQGEAPTWSAQRVEVITEFHIARDLAFAGKLDASSIATSFDQVTEREKHDAPDLVVVLDDELVVCEGKFFDACDTATLDAQLRSQRRQVRYLFALRPELRGYRHVAILPAEPDDHPDCDVVVTWDDIAELAAEVLGPTHYVTGRLRAAVARYQSLIGTAGVRNYDGILPLDAVLDKCLALGDSVHVGHVGGEANMLDRSLAYLETKSWKWRGPSTNAGPVIGNNWIPGIRFVRLIERRRDEVGRTTTRWDREEG